MPLFPHRSRLAVVTHLRIQEKWFSGITPGAIRGVLRQSKAVDHEHAPAQLATAAQPLQLRRSAPERGAQANLSSWERCRTLQASQTMLSAFAGYMPP